MVPDETTDLPQDAEQSGPVELTVNWWDAESAFTTSAEDEFEAFLDRESGEVVMLFDPDVVGDIEGAEDLRKKVDEDPERFLKIDPISSHQSFEFMEDFVDFEVEGEVQEALRERLRRRKPFRQFRDGLDEVPDLTERWYRFHDECLVAYAERWFHANGVEVTFANLPAPSGK